MVIMERSKLPELAASTSVQEQNTTDEEKSAATGLDSVQWSRPFLDMVYHALDSPDDDYHALFVLCLLYAMSHNKGFLSEERCGSLASPVEAERSGSASRGADGFDEDPFIHFLSENSRCLCTTWLDTSEF
ncbi:unnamed protein product [Rangifer tarandus platyrhynchus]|uniref:CLEC16A/TT9 C-terminal domain-containing protein n=1 Tax=Rangifer tarandus platyrhynchus TaxID=3082113 RepID=A0ABN8XJM4_RANTA|nr:unnamed protein product [Rangifer tarandus platyrhynchus]